MAGNLLGATLGGDVLHLHQLRAPTLAGEIQQVLRDQGHGPASASLPRRVRGRVDNDLTDYTPAGVVGVTTGDQEPRQGLSHADGPGFGSVAVEVSQRSANTATVIHGASELDGGPPRFEGCLVDARTMVAALGF